jgi:hypothetical protein
MDSVSVGVGRAVVAGEPIGRLGPGDDKAARPPELYLELRGPQGALDPARWMAEPARAALTKLRSRICDVEAIRPSLA